MDDIYENFDKYNSNENRIILIAFYDIVDDMFSNEKLNPIVTELFIRSRKPNVSLVFIT